MRDDTDAEQQSHRANMEAVRATGFLWDCNMFRQAACLEQDQRKRCTYQTVEEAR